MAEQDHELGALRGAQLLDLAQERQLGCTGPTEDDRRPAGREIRFLEQGPDGRSADADADGDEVVAGSGGVGEDPIGALDHDPGSGAYAKQPAAAPAQVADRDAEEATAVGPDHGARGEGKRMLGMPEAPAKEAPVEILTAAGVQLVQPAADQLDRHGVGGLLDDSADHQSVLEARDQRPEHPIVHEAEERDREQPGPEPEGRPIVEQPTHRELVRQRHQDRGIADQVNDMPDLIGHLAPSRHDRGHRDQGQEGQADHGQNEVPRPPELAELGERIETVGEGIPDQQQRRVQHQTEEGCLAELGMQPRGLVLPDGPIDHGNPGSQDQHDRHSRCCDETGDDPEPGEDATERGEVAQPAISQEDRQRRGQQHERPDGQDIPHSVAAARSHAWRLRRGGPGGGVRPAQRL